MTPTLRVGLMVPANNTTMARELPQWLPGYATVTTVRIPRGVDLLTRDTLPAYRDAALELARAFAKDSVDCVAYGCTAAGFLGGPAADRELAADLMRVTGKPVVTTAGAMVAVLRGERLARIAVITPYGREVNTQLRAFLADGGIGVGTLATLDAADVDALGRLTSADVLALARTALDPSCDGMFIACSQLPTADAIGQLEQQWGKPVWSSIRATARQLVRHHEARTAA